MCTFYKFCIGDCYVEYFSQPIRLNIWPQSIEARISPTTCRMHPLEAASVNQASGDKANYIVAAPCSDARSARLCSLPCLWIGILSLRKLKETALNKEHCRREWRPPVPGAAERPTSVPLRYYAVFHYGKKQYKSTTVASSEDSVDWNQVHATFCASFVADAPIGFLCDRGSNCLG